MPRRSRPSSTARIVAVTRARATRPVVPTGDAAAEDRVVRSLRLPAPLRLPLPGMAGYIASRTAFFDERLLAACRSGTRQVVMVGAGYDGRSLRLRQPGVQFFEVDHPVTQADKVARLDRLGIDASDVRFVPVDLGHQSVPEALAAAGHDPTLPSHFVCEGLAPYLPMAVLTHLLRSLASCAGPGSTISLDFAAPGHHMVGRVQLALVRFGVAALGERMVTFRTGPQAAALLRETGWSNVDLPPPPGSLPVVFAAATSA